MNKRGNKKAIEIETLIYWIIGIFILAIGILAIILFKDKGAGALEYIKNLFRLKG
jgi:hypothetical protein